MKKRKKNHHQNRPEHSPAVPNGGEPIEQMLAELLAHDDGLEAASEEETTEEETTETAYQPDPVDGQEPAFAAAETSEDSEAGMAELAAALEALERGEAGQPASDPVAPPGAAELVRAAEDPAAEGFDDIPEPLEADWEVQVAAEQEAGQGAEAGAEPSTGEPSAVSEPEVWTTDNFDAGEEMLQQMLSEAEAETEPVVAAEPVVLAEPQQELLLEPLAPQPPLEHVLGGIDEGLEKAPSLTASESASSPAVKHVSQLDDYVVFALAGSDYAVPVRDIAEIGRVPSITRVPSVPDFIRGITNLRGEMMPLLSLCGLLGLHEAPQTARGRVLFLRASEHVAATGLLVDEVKGIQRIQSQQLEQVTGLIDDKVTSVLRGVHGRGDRLLNILDVEQLFQLQEFRQLEAMQ